MKARVLCFTSLSTALLVATAFAAAAAPAKGSYGLVVTRFLYALEAGDAARCPQGMAVNGTEFLLQRLSSSERKRLSNPDLTMEMLNRQRYGAKGEDLCGDPQSIPDPGFRTVQGNGTARGLDLAGSQSPGSTCEHGRFVSAEGKPIDNQLYRLLGCVKGYQPGDAIESYHSSAYNSGEMTVLLELIGVDDPANDPEVEVGIFASSDPAPIVSPGVALRNYSLQVHDDARYHSRLRGRIRDGVLTTDPGDVRLQLNTGFVRADHVLKSARLELKLAADRSVTGQLAGYYDVDAFYDQIRKAGGFAQPSVGYTCPGLFNALHRLADGNRDPASGQCTSISMAFSLDAVPAFVIHPGGKGPVQSAER